MPQNGYASAVNKHCITLRYENHAIEKVCTNAVNKHYDYKNDGIMKITECRQLLFIDSLWGVKTRTIYIKITSSSFLLLFAFVYSDLNCVQVNFNKSLYYFMKNRVNVF